MDTSTHSRLKTAIDTIETHLKPAIDLLPEELREYWLVLVGAAALIVLLPLAWYKRRLLRRLIGLPPAACCAGTQARRGWLSWSFHLDCRIRVGYSSRERLARLRLAVVAPLGKGETTIEETAHETCSIRCVGA